MILSGQTALVTGGSRGIGHAICVALAQAGANVVFSYAGNATAAEETLRLLQSMDCNALAVQSDVSDEAQVKDLIAQTTAAFGAIDILVNNAGITRDGLLMTMKEADFDAVIDTNLKGAFFTMKAVCRPMMKRRSGCIINLSSVVGVHGNAGQVNYSASKAGLIGMTKSLAKEVASRNITVNAIAPGFIETDMTEGLPAATKEALLSTIPMGRLGQGEDIAKAVVFLASAPYITGQVLGVDGGMGM
ncbi:3-oxoacyl-[acyl-carrier-protein] reductase [Bengtsoniella intestinalis]|uniref:3-oxoacyl-[acyl-carrier-protein] reductase n=1 Tax=Bengtsoniella intestinalis TaxID=3073143 RepID=UPI00391F7863